MDIPTVPGTWYTVASTTTCEITDTATGTPLGTAEAGSYTFQAQGNLTTLSDDSALYSKSNFKHAPAALMALGLLGGGVKYPGFDLEKYAHCVTVADMQAVNADYKNDLTADGAWIYPLPMLKDIAPGFMASADKLRKFKLEMPELVITYKYLETYAFENSSLEYLELYAPKITNGKAIANSAKNLKEAKITAPIATALSECFANCPSLIKAEMIAPKSTSGWYVFSGDSSLEVVIIDYNDQITNGTGMYEKCKKLKVFPTSYASLTKAPYMFFKCEITAQQAIEICQSIPQWSDGAAHAITLGIHVDHQADDEVLSAIAEAEGKGWTLTVQWNGTPTAQSASTFGLRRPTIYAKLGNIERPDGTMEQFLDWGHYVTDWEANGYMEFASVEDANAYFGIHD